MNSFLRLFGLVVFSAAGVALAVWLASSVPAPVAQNPAVPESPVELTPPEPVAAEPAAEAATEPTSEDSTPAVAEESDPQEEREVEQRRPPRRPIEERRYRQTRLEQARLEPSEIEDRAPEPRESLGPEFKPSYRHAVAERRDVPPTVATIAADRDFESWPVAPAPTISRIAISEPVPENSDRAVLDKLLKLTETIKQQQANSGPKLPGPADAELPRPREIDEPGEESRRAPTPAVAPAPAASPGLGRAPKTEIKSNGHGDNSLTIHIQDSDIREVLDMLSEQGGLNILASRNVQGKVSASLTNVDIDTALAAILKSTGYVARREGKFIFVGSPQDFHAMEQAGDKIGTRVYRPNYVKAVDLQALITPLLTPQIGTASVTKPSQVGIASDSGQVGGDGFGGMEALLVRDFEAVLIEVDQVFEEIDKRPMQVSIEAMILSVKLDDENKRGVDFEFLRSNPHIRFATGSPVDDLSQISFTEGGLKFAFLDSNVGVFVNALETIGDTNIIATPRLMCLNKQRAEILIGAKLGYITKTLTQTTTTQSVDFLEVGTQLRLRPFISTDGMIRMEVHPELSTGEVKVEEGMTIPDKQVTEVTTNVMVRDGCTVIIGGLMQEELDKTASQVPLLGSAPGIGFLFRRKTETIKRSEIIVLITPHIVYEPEVCKEGLAEASAYHDRQAVYNNHTSPIGTRYLGRKYLRMAEKEFSKGNFREALHQVNVALVFDPTCRPAIDLRHAIFDKSGGRGYKHAGAALRFSAEASSPDLLDSKTISPALLEGLEGADLLGLGGDFEGPMGEGPMPGGPMPGTLMPGRPMPGRPMRGGPMCDGPSCGPGMPPVDQGQTGRVLRIERAGSIPCDQ